MALTTEKREKDDDQPSPSGRVSMCTWVKLPSSLLYFSYFLSSWGDRMWRFAVGLYLVYLSGGELRLAAIFGFSAGGAIILFGGMIGNWVDNNSRLKVVRLSLFAQNFSVMLSAIAVYVTLAYREQLATTLYGGVLPQLCEAIIILFAVVAQLTSVAYKISIEKDWIVVVAAGDKAKLANLNAITRTIDQSCKGVAPVVTGLIMTVTSLTTAAICIAVWNLTSVFVEYGILSQVYRLVPQLAIKDVDSDSVSEEKVEMTRDDDDKDVTGDDKITDEPTSPLRSDGAEEAEGRRKRKKKEKKSLAAVLFDPFIVVYTGWRTYARQRVLCAGIALACLYMTVLGFDSITTGYIYANGLSELLVGLAMSLGGITGVLGSLSFTWFRRRVGLERTGLFAFNFEIVCLALCVASVWAPGSLFEPDTLFQSHHGVNLQNCTVVVAGVTKSSHINPYFESDVSCGKRPVPREKISIWLFLIGIITSRVGLWMADLAVTQLMQENVRERERGIVNGVQNSLNMFMDVIKFTLVIFLPYIETFGYLILLSFAFICLASAFFAGYSHSVRGHLLHYSKIFFCFKKRKSANHSVVQAGDATDEGDQVIS